MIKYNKNAKSKKYLKNTYSMKEQHKNVSFHVYL